MSAADELPALRRTLVGASDTALGQVVAMLDRMPARGEADAMLDPVRPRLRQLRPPRPLGLARLLFLPLNGAIVPATGWKRGAAQVPRSVLLLLAGAVRAQLGATAAAIDIACDGRSTADLALVGELGARLWPAAAGLAAQAPESWAGCGLRPEDFAPLHAICTGVWRHGPALWAAMCAAAEGPPETLARAALSGLAAEPLTAFQAGFATLLARATAPGTLSAIAAGLGANLGAVAERVLDGWLDGCTPDFALESAASGAAAASAFHHAMRDLEAAPCSQGSARRARLALLRRAASEACCARFATLMHATVAAPVAQLGPGMADAATVGSLEDAARALRGLDAAGRRLGQPEGYDRIKTETVARLLPAAARGAGLGRMDVARLVEILAGPDAALAVLGDG